MGDVSMSWVAMGHMQWVVLGGWGLCTGVWCVVCGASGAGQAEDLLMKEGGANVLQAHTPHAAGSSVGFAPTCPAPLAPADLSPPQAHLRGRQTRRDVGLMHEHGVTISPEVTHPHACMPL